MGYFNSVISILKIQFYQLKEQLQENNPQHLKVFLLFLVKL